MNIVDLNSLRSVQSTGAETLLETLKSVELNVTEICNRTCHFCPRGDPNVYPNSKFSMSLELVDLLSKQLAEFNYKNRISLVGFGEPFLYKNLIPAIKTIHNNLPNLQWLEINTNGDFLTKEIIKELTDAGCNQLTVAMYDKDISESIKELCSYSDVNLTFKHCYPEKFEVRVVNRTNILVKDELLNFNKRCNLPFYKVLIDWNGDVIICTNDWGRQGKIDNITNNSIKDIWLGDTLMNYRRHLLKGDRASLNPCKYCNVDGTLLGEQSVMILEKVKC